MRVNTERARAGLLIAFVVGLYLPADWGNAADTHALPSPLNTLREEVIGGIPVKLADAPWQVALVSAVGEHVEGLFCGGTLIDSQWVLTAAHCLYQPLTCAKLSQRSFFVAYGSTELGKKISLMAPAELHHPEGYDCRGKDYDIALVKLPEPVWLDTYIQLPSPAEASTLVAPGVRLQTVGWGLTNINGWKSRDLLEVTVPVIAYDICKAYYSAILPAAAICAGEEGKDACSGDSGGPLYRRKLAGSEAVQLGIVSFGDSCGKAKVPGVYTPVAEHLTWIAQTRASAPCTPKAVAAAAC